MWVKSHESNICKFKDLGSFSAFYLPDKESVYIKLEHPLMWRHEDSIKDSDLADGNLYRANAVAAGTAWLVEIDPDTWVERLPDAVLVPGGVPEDGDHENR